MSNKSYQNETATVSSGKKYFYVSGVSRIGVTLTTHELLCESDALLGDVHEALRKLHAVKGIRVREARHLTAQEVLRADREHRLVRREVKHAD